MQRNVCIVNGSSDKSVHSCDTTSESRAVRKFANAVFDNNAWVECLVRSTCRASESVSNHCSFFNAFNLVDKIQDRFWNVDTVSNHFNCHVFH
ncbi:hypothetical protein EVA_12052 [gut metagenome]|uniref:Uncharacterized protein n=1 Tax=gut metagenome TaxID=749906 RepID=J9GJQ3_9ZZZZ